MLGFKKCIKRGNLFCIRQNPKDTSTTIVYNNNFIADECLNENHICYPKTIYALSKHYAENLFKIYATPLGINWNILRMYNVYGPGQQLFRIIPRTILYIICQILMNRVLF